MKAQYIDNGQPGYGKIIFSEALFPGSPWSVSIQRASDKKFMTGKRQNPWVGEAIFLAMEGETPADGTLVLKFGPDVVDQLDPQEQYALILKGNGPEEKARLRVENITYSAASSLGNPAPEPQAPPVVQPAPQVPVQEPEHESAVETTPEPLQMPQNRAETPKNNKLWLWTLVALIFLACTVWFVLDFRKSNETASTSLQTAGQTAAPKAEQPQKEPGTEEQVRKFFLGGSMSPKDAVALAAKLPRNTPAEQDAVYRLWYFAAENGENSILPMYGESLDPSMPKFGSIEKNGTEAWKIYEKMKAADPQKADAAMQRLKSWLAKEESQGNVKARDWLLAINQGR